MGCSSVSYLASGGVLTAAALVHLLPDASETLDGLVPRFPLASFLCGIGFFVTMIVEALGTTAGSPAPRLPSLGRESSCGSLPAGMAPAGAKSLGQSLSSAERGDASSDAESAGEVREEVSVLLSHGVQLKVSGDVQWTVALLVLVCLSFHSLVAGIALGVSTEANMVLDLLVAVVAHKGLATSALATAMLRGGASWSVFLPLIVGFSCVTPVGVGIGLAMSAGLEGSPWTAVLLAFASGTFLHVGMVEMIVHELHKAADDADEEGRSLHALAARCGCSGQALGLAAAGAGFVAMSALAVWV